MDALDLYGSESTSSSSSSSNDDNEYDFVGKTHEGSSVEIPIVKESDARRNEIFARNVPHTVGNWASYIYLDLEEEEDCHDDDEDQEDEAKEGHEESKQSVSPWRQGRQRWIHHLRHTLQSRKLAIPALVLHDSCHVSLSKTFYLQGYNIESFVKSLQDALLASAVKAPLTLRVQANPVTVLTNAADLVTTTTTTAKTTAALLCRTFWCATVHPPLTDLIALVDDVLQAWQLPPFYDPPQFHTSWASAAGDWTSSNNNSSVVALPDNESFLFIIKHVTCRIGHKVFRIPLSTTS